MYVTLCTLSWNLHKKVKGLVPKKGTGSTDRNTCCNHISSHNCLCVRGSGREDFHVVFGLSPVLLLMIYELLMLLAWKNSERKWWSLLSRAILSSHLYFPFFSPCADDFPNTNVLFVTKWLQSITDHMIRSCDGKQFKLFLSCQLKDNSNVF